ncbi:MAG: PAS domain-containing protein [Rhodospirillales bacterium]|nr:PAS domain-containing protein [Rhodospirillales bacterium]
MPEQKTGIERRMVQRLLTHWRSVQDEGSIPSLKSILELDLGDIVPNLYVLKMKQDGSDPVFERIGRIIAGEAGSSLAGQPVSAVTEKTLLSQAIRYRDKVQAKTVPITLGGEFTDANGDVILYRSVILPLSEGDGFINALIGAANCKKKED